MSVGWCTDLGERQKSSWKGDIITILIMLMIKATQHAVLFCIVCELTKLCHTLNLVIGLLLVDKLCLYWPRLKIYIFNLSLLNKLAEEDIITFMQVLIVKMMSEYCHVISKLISVSKVFNLAKHWRTILICVIKTQSCKVKCVDSFTMIIWTKLASKLCKHIDWKFRNDFNHFGTFET